MEPIIYVHGPQVHLKYNDFDLMHQASDLTEACAPETVPKTADTLNDTLMNSVMALSPQGKGHKLVGFVTAEPLCEGVLGDPIGRNMMFKPAILKVASLVVDESFRGQGHATKLLKMLLEKQQPDKILRATKPWRSNYTWRVTRVPANLVTITSCPALFEKLGFQYTTQDLDVPNEAWHARVAEIEDDPKKKVMSKLVEKVTSMNVIYDQREGKVYLP